MPTTYLCEGLVCPFFSCILAHFLTMCSPLHIVFSIFGRVLSVRTLSTIYVYATRVDSFAATWSSSAAWLSLSLSIFFFLSLPFPCTLPSFVCLVFRCRMRRSCSPIDRGVLLWRHHRRPSIPRWRCVPAGVRQQLRPILLIPRLVRKRRLCVYRRYVLLRYGMAAKCRAPMKCVAKLLGREMSFLCLQSVVEREVVWLC